MILSALENGSILYKGATSATMKTLDPIHNATLRTSISAFKSSPVLSTINLTGSKSIEKHKNIILLKVTLDGLMT